VAERHCTPVTVRLVAERHCTPVTVRLVAERHCTPVTVRLVAERHCTPVTVRLVAECRHLTTNIHRSSQTAQRCSGPAPLTFTSQCGQPTYLVHFVCNMATTDRFPEFNDEQLLKVSDDNDKLSDRSKNTIKYSVAVLSNYATTSNGTLREVEEMPAASLDTYLSRFYAQLREKDGSLYMKSAVIKSYALTLYCDIVYIACTHFQMRYNKTNKRLALSVTILQPITAVILILNITFHHHSSNHTSRNLINIRIGHYWKLFALNWGNIALGLGLEQYFPNFQ